MMFRCAACVVVAALAIAACSGPAMPRETAAPAEVPAVVLPAAEAAPKIADAGLAPGAEPYLPPAPAETATPVALESTETMALLTITVQDKTGNPVPGTVASVRRKGGEVVLSGVSDADGLVRGLIPIAATYVVRFVSLDPEREVINYGIVVPDDNYQDLSLKLTYLPSVSRTFILEGVEFETGAAKLKLESYARLADLLEYMTVKRSVEIELAGHTDDVGDDAANQQLSDARARSVKAYLVSKGIAVNRIRTVGYGESQPIATNETPEGRQKNRRTVVTVLNE